MAPRIHWWIVGGVTRAPLLYLLFSISRIDLYKPPREFLKQIMRGVSAQNRTLYMQCSALPLHKPIFYTTWYSIKPAFVELKLRYYIKFEDISAFCVLLHISYVYTELRRREREAPVHFCLPGITSGEQEKAAAWDRGWRLVSSTKQEVAQHLFLGIQKGSGWPAMCFKE